jgi:4-hydroxybenzoate polyprenyltransferase
LDLVLVAHQVDLGTFFYLGLTVAVWFVLYQQRLIADREPKHCFKAFLNNNYFGMAIFFGLVMHYFTHAGL